MLLQALLLTLVAADTYNFTDANKRNTLRMELDAPIENIQAIANGIEGSVTVDGDRASGVFKVRVDSIKTGNDSRDGHLQNDKWLDAKKWPYLELSFKDVALQPGFKDGKTSQVVKAKGEFNVHGVKKTQEVEVKLDYMKESEVTKNRAPGNLVRVRSDFEIKLSDYNVATSDSGVKKLIGLKVGEIAQVRIDFVGTDAAGK